MAKCNWDPSKHNGQPCPVHGANGDGGIIKADVRNSAIDYLLYHGVVIPKNKIVGCYAFDDDNEWEMDAMEEEEQEDDQNPNNWNLEQICDWYNENVFGMNLNVEDDKIIGKDAEGEEVNWDLNEARYNITEFLKGNQEIDDDIEKEFEDEFKEHK